MGTLAFEAQTRVALNERLVSFSDLKISESSFPTLPREQIREVTEEITRTFPAEDRIIGLDRVLASIDRSQIIPKNVEGIKADPPPIYFSQTPAFLVILDGEPIWSPIQGNDLKFAVNTNWDLFEHTPSKVFYLRQNTGWLMTSDLQGPWKPAGKLPASFSKLPDDENWKDVKSAVPGKKISAKSCPAIFVSLQPAELILLEGEPKYVPVGGTQLLWVENTESDLFRYGESGEFYFLVAGRWFSASDLKGPWTFASLTLPEDFKAIPLEHQRSRVLASVPGTQQAAEAVLLAQIPQTAKVNRKEIQAPEVVYQGEPNFQPIEKTSVERAVNTDKDIIKVGDLYYMCFQGVWFLGKSAEGPWEAASSVPKEIYEIPTSSPAHNVTYVTVVEDDDDDEWVTYAALAGFTGLMIGWGCAVWGTGYYYPPYWGWGPYYPYYYPRYPTYGYGAWYNPWTGGYGRTAVAYGPYGGAGVTARYNPATGTYSRGAAAWGPYGARGVGEAYNPYTGTYGRTRQGSSVYGSWGTTAVQRGDEWAQTSRVTNNLTGTTTRVTRGDEGAGAITRRGPEGSGGIARTEGGDVYAGRDGNIYRKQDGSWQKYDGGGGWSTVERPDSAPSAGTRDLSTSISSSTPRTREAQPSASNRSSTAQPSLADRSTTGQSGARVQPSNRSTYEQLDRDSRVRSEGAQRTRDYGSYQSGGWSSRSAGSYRPSSTGMRGGGSRRR